MIKVIECALISRDIYGQPFIINAFTNNSLIPKNYSGFARMLDVDPYMHPARPFYCQLYLKFKNGLATDAVIAIRCTLLKSLDNKWEDFYTWYSDVIGEGKSDHPPSYLGKAMHYVSRVKTYLHHHFPSVTRSHLYYIPAIL